MSTPLLGGGYNFLRKSKSQWKKEGGGEGGQVWSKYCPFDNASSLFGISNPPASTVTTVPILLRYWSLFDIYPILPRLLDFFRPTFLPLPTTFLLPLPTTLTHSLSTQLVSLRYCSLFGNVPSCPRLLDNFPPSFPPPVFYFSLTCARRSGAPTFWVLERFWPLFSIPVCWSSLPVCAAAPDAFMTFLCLLYDRH